jgi:hypothetical protein
VQLLIGFVAGAAALLVVAALAAMLSDGRVAVLEMRGLPILIGGGVSVVVFALVRTSRQGPPQLAPGRKAALGSAVGGFALLIVLAAILFQPAVAGRAQRQLERAVSVFGASDTAAVQSFVTEITAWNAEAKRFGELISGFDAADLQPVPASTPSPEPSPDEASPDPASTPSPEPSPVESDLERFRSRVSSSEAALQEIITQMHGHAESAEHPELRDALDDVASKFEDRLAGLRLVSRGLLLDDHELVKSGDERYKEAKRRSEQLFEDDLRPVLERAGLDADAFARELSA